MEWGPRTSERARRGAACALLSLALGGCATWSRHGLAAKPPAKLRLAVAPIELAVSVKRLRDIESVPKGSAPADEKELARRGLEQAASELESDLERRLGASYFFEVAPDSDVRRALSSEGLASSTAPWTARQARRLGRALGVQAVLLPTLSGYGKVKTRWVALLVGSGMIEGLAQGVAVAATLGNPWVAAGVGAEEAAQESVEWVGGAYLFDRFYTPVILEGRLVSVADGKIVWSATALEAGAGKAAKKLPKEERKLKQVRLRLTAARAADRLAQKLDRKAWANLR
ncbi:MAG: hypothetical protein KGO96_10885 [Elusimicrobia bacterium]|nr:hypothetical protein [Elusimicrobiota bacterium]MDE2236665.1 hypothetical protein [Elusimicrobiota bacterium]MDE2426397.1 hypothetical protein [Elusimicrobiota bacterium]